MSDTTWHDWPFFDEPHREMARALDAWCANDSAATPAARATRSAAQTGHEGAAAHVTGAVHDVDAECREWVRKLGEAGWLRYCVPAGPDGRWGGALAQVDSRAVCILRETLARHEGLADFALAMQGLGSGAISLGGSDALRDQYLPKVASGEAIAAFALSEPEAGSDVAAMTCSARLDGDSYVLDGEKTWISNGGIADFYCVFARTAEAPGARGITAFVVDADTPGLTIAERIDVIAPHPLARLSFKGCRVPVTHRLGEAGQGFKLAMMTLDIFRASVAAAALGFARRALDEAVERARTRRMFGQVLGDLQLTQAALGDMATDVDASALLTYRAAWLRDVKGVRTTREAAMAKMAATESAQRVIDRALQMFGGAGVVSGAPVEKLYREIRALRIYEGATEVQKLIIARELLKH